MIADFPEIKKKLERSLSQFLKKQIDIQAQMLVFVSQKPLCEGNKMGIVRENDTHIISELKEVSSTATIKNEDFYKITSEDWSNQFVNLAKDIAGQIDSSIIKAANEAVEETGNIISSKGGLTSDSYLEALEKLPISFENEDRSKPNLPGIATHPTTIEKALELAKQETQEEKLTFHKRMEEILDKKYKEHLKEMATRRIID